VFTKDAQVPSEFKVGSVIVPSVWVKLTGVAATFGIIWVVAELFGL
jgi:hypothetical protein